MHSQELDKDWFCLKKTRSSQARGSGRGDGRRGTGKATQEEEAPVAAWESDTPPGITASCSPRVEAKTCRLPRDSPFL